MAYLICFIIGFLATETLYTVRWLYHYRPPGKHRKNDLAIPERVTLLDEKLYNPAFVADVEAVFSEYWQETPEVVLEAETPWETVQGIQLDQNSAYPTNYDEYLLKFWKGGVFNGGERKEEHEGQGNGGIPEEDRGGEA